MSSVDTTAEDHDEHHDDHDHGEFIAHHFDTPEQQHDSGKLGIWVFLVTEVLFFSGLFCAYVLLRYHQPEVFVAASEHLDKVLGGINTIVLLFSSLTMAWAVRAAQLGQNRFASRLILITMVCAAVFLGIKAVEYSHKWDLNIYVASHYNFIDGYHPEPADSGMAGALGVSQSLVNLCVLPGILLVGFAVAGVVLRIQNKRLVSQLFFGMTIMMGGFFLGAVGGQVYQNAAHAGDSHDTEHGEHGGDEGHAATAEVTGPDTTSKYPSPIGMFFSIYYIMTGLHA
ncbi:MAG: cytochrome c oxidase subunit 3, partial [Pirellulaceae bacterium]